MLRVVNAEGNGRLRAGLRAADDRGVDGCRPGEHVLTDEAERTMAEALIGETGQMAGGLPGLACGQLI